MNLAIKRRMALILLFACVFALLAGCTNPATPTDPTITDPTTVTDPTTETPPRLFGGITNFTADLFAQYALHSFSYVLDITVSKGVVYINDTLYDKISYVDNPGVAFHKAEFYWYSDEELADSIFEQINACDKCYLLEISETEENTTYGKKIAIYEINGICYFVRISKQVVYIHCFDPETNYLKLR